MILTLILSRCHSSLAQVPRRRDPYFGGPQDCPPNQEPRGRRTHAIQAVICLVVWHLAHCLCWPSILEARHSSLQPNHRQSGFGWWTADCQCDSTKRGLWIASNGKLPIQVESNAPSQGQGFKVEGASIQKGWQKHPCLPQHCIQWLQIWAGKRWWLETGSLPNVQWPCVSLPNLDEQYTK